MWLYLRDDHRIIHGNTIQTLSFLKTLLYRVVASGTHFTNAYWAHNWNLVKILLALNTLRPRQNGRRFTDDTFKCIFLNENVRSSIEISLKVVPKGLINNNPALVQIMTWRQSGDKPLYEPMIVYWRIYVSLGLNKLILNQIITSPQLSCGDVQNYDLIWSVFFMTGGTGQQIFFTRFGVWAHKLLVR